MQLPNNLTYICNISSSVSHNVIMVLTPGGKGHEGHLKILLNTSKTLFQTHLIFKFI